ncbi:MAG: NAD(P)/FAD-dependent oxidoreductase [Acidobacteria bacterium]|nr:NAD(P)/FAD-dependent oxidoreductase [Acidobacteriota bacterium]
MGDLSRPYDAIIVGGGLAGLTLARQLHLEVPALRVLLAEKRTHPVPEAAFKVGESSVEVGAHYFQVVLGLEPHLRSQHLEKLGIRYFFPHGDNRDIATRVEVGPVRFPAVPSFQIDRGRLENWLLSDLRQAGVEALDGCTVRQIELGSDEHRVTIASGDMVREVRGRFLVDASGRAGLIRRRLGLTRRVTHEANACWFRVKSRVRVDDWSEDPGWRARVPCGRRWLSTNHLMGRGYWVWLIPLGSGSTSIGIVADARLHPYGRLNRYERALDWLREFEPQCAEVLQAQPDDLEDFLALRHYAHGCERVFSPDHWALVGEAGVFTDPFYSPGSDFIAIGNDAAADLIARRARGEDVRARAESFNTMYLRLFDGFIRLYDGQYPLMGNAQVMTAKASWDNACYWAITGLLYFQRRYRRPEFLQQIEPLMRRFFVLHARMQQFLRAWDVADPHGYSAEFANVVQIEWLRELQAGLAGPSMEDAALQARIERNLSLLERFAGTWQALAMSRTPGLTAFTPALDPVDISELCLTALSPAGISS